MVASSQPLASAAGLRVLQGGGNAVDAAIAVAAALAVTEPCSTGLGGDCFMLYYDAASKRVHGLNGSGRCPAELTRERAIADVGQVHKLPDDHGHAVTVPGAVAGWLDAMQEWGSKSVDEVFAPAIALGRDGFAIGPITSALWQAGVHQLERTANGQELLRNGRAPRPGELFRNENVAECLAEIAREGRQAFYGPNSRIAQAIVDIVHTKGGVMSLEDLVSHQSSFVDPIKTGFEGLDVYEIPPNGQGIAALIALNIIDCSIDRIMSESDQTPTEQEVSYWHTLIESLRLAFADARWYVCDPLHQIDIPVEALLSQEYASQRAQLIDPSRATIDPVRGSPVLSSDTVSFQVVDGFGNAVSMVNSNYDGFGTGFVPKNCGFSLQNRACNFVLDDPTHPNSLKPAKRPYHTIIPVLTCHRKTQELHATFSVMGGFMQPQGHVQVLTNMLFRGFNVQEALDAPRFCIDCLSSATKKSVVYIEEGISAEVVQRLQALGHEVQVQRRAMDRIVFGRGQIIVRDPDTGVLSAGSDGRSDGCAMGW